MTQLTSIEAIERVVQRYVADNPSSMLGVHFPSGRTIHVDPDTVNLASRSARWLREYTVQHQGNYLELIPTTFVFTPQGNRQALQSDIAAYQSQVNRYQRSISRWQDELAALDSSRVLGTSSADLEALVDRWPELIDIRITNQIVVTFVPVIFSYNSRVAMSSSLTITMKRDAEWYGSRHDVHPHMSGSGVICSGNMQQLFRTVVDSNQVIAALDLIRRWRVGFNPGDEVTSSWRSRGWRWLQDVRSRRVSTAWDGTTVQDNLSGNILTLGDALGGQIDGYIHFGQTNGWVGLSDVPTLSSTPQECSGCKGTTIDCSCHGSRCVGCQREDTWCTCPESRYVLVRNADLIWAVVPPNEYTNRCAECSSPEPNIIYRPLNSNPTNIRLLDRYCCTCALRQEGVLPAHVARALELRAEIEGETNDSTHEDGTPDDGASSSQGA